MNRFVTILLVFFLFVTTSYPANADERIWVHVNFIGNYIDSLCFVTGVLPQTAHMELFDANENSIKIDPYGCIDTGAISTPCPSGGYWRVHSAWGIDQVTAKKPKDEQLMEKVPFYDYFGIKDYIPAWYAVDIPTGFEPVKYISGCSEYDQFQMPGISQISEPSNDQNSDSAAGGGGGGGGGCFLNCMKLLKWGDEQIKACKNNT